MDTLIFADESTLENVLIGFSRGVLTIRSIDLPLREVFDMFTDETKTATMKTQKTGETFTDYTWLVSITNQESITVKMTRG